jgi:hypothetical protein
VCESSSRIVIRAPSGSRPGRYFDTESSSPIFPCATSRITSTAVYVFVVLPLGKVSLARIGVFFALSA